MPKKLGVLVTVNPSLCSRSVPCRTQPGLTPFPTSYSEVRSACVRSLCPKTWKVTYHLKLESVSEALLLRIPSDVFSSRVFVKTRDLLIIRSWRSFSECFHTQNSVRRVFVPLSLPRQEELLIIRSWRSVSGQIPRDGKQEIKPKHQKVFASVRKTLFAPECKACFVWSCNQHYKIVFDFPSCDSVRRNNAEFL